MEETATPTSDDEALSNQPEEVLPQEQEQLSDPPSQGVDAEAGLEYDVRS